MLSKIIGKIFICELTLLHGVNDFHILAHILFGLILESLQSLSDISRTDLCFHINIEKGSENREGHNTQHPGQLKRRVFLRIDDIDYGNRTDNTKDSVQIGPVVRKEINPEKHDKNLDQDQKKNDSSSAVDDAEKFLLYFSLFFLIPT